MTGSVILLASLGGFISFLSTTIGAFLSLTSWRIPGFEKFKFSLDFALGLMLSAVAFSLVGPTALNSINDPELLKINLFGFVSGGLLIYFLKKIVEYNQDEKQINPSQLLLTLALIIHNFPEGLASGAALAGLDIKSATPILTAITLQNIPEGLLMVFCLRAMGWSSQKAIWGGVASGFVEFIGGIASGLALGWTSQALPIILMFAGGAMFTSVIIELTEKSNPLKQLRKPEFAVGLLIIPLMNNLIT